MQNDLAIERDILLKIDRPELKIDAVLIEANSLRVFLPDVANPGPQFPASADNRPPTVRATLLRLSVDFQGFVIYLANCKRFLGAARLGIETDLKTFGESFRQPDRDAEALDPLFEMVLRVDERMLNADE